MSVFAQLFLRHLQACAPLVRCFTSGSHLSGLTAWPCMLRSKEYIQSVANMLLMYIRRRAQHKLVIFRLDATLDCNIGHQRPGKCRVRNSCSYSERIGGGSTSVVFQRPGPVAWAAAGLYSGDACSR